LKTPLVFFAAFSHIKRSTILHVVPAHRLNVFTPRAHRARALPAAAWAFIATSRSLLNPTCPPPPVPSGPTPQLRLLPFTETSAACPRRPVGVTATAAIGVDLCIGRTPTHPRAPGAFSDRGSYRGIGQRKTLEGKRRQLYFLHHSISSHASDPLTVLLSWPARRSIDLLPSVARSDWSLP
jgi:hypothetical protein